MLLGPAFGRIPEIFDASPFLAAPMVLTLQLAPAVHDWVVRRRLHIVTSIGAVCSIASIPLIIGLSGSSEWAGLLESILGVPGGKGAV